jgi:two-component system, OmpR family, alkaline phosphatase synthesis response regulator PhoP
MAPPEGRRLLLVEDDEAMAIALRDGFSYEGYRVTVAADGETGLRLAETTQPDLLLLDVMLPKMSGFDVCKALRDRGNRVPIIMLTARGQEIDKVMGLRLGADDYISKPFGFLELLARVEAVLRRTASAPEEVYRSGDLVVDLKRLYATRRGERLNLSPREFRLLAYFVQHRGELLTREQLLESAWEHEGNPFTRTVDMHVAKLRKKIEDDPADPKHILTAHRLGYRFVD